MKYFPWAIVSLDVFRLIGLRVLMVASVLPLPRHIGTHTHTHTDRASDQASDGAETASSS